VKFPEAPRAAPHGGGFRVACVTSFGFDEPIEAILEAAHLLPDVMFHMTGNPNSAPERLARKPSNVLLTGFLSVADYGLLLQSADVVLALTTLEHTMLRGAYEAIYQGTPVILSDSETLRRAFDEGAVHVNNTPGAIAAAIDEIRQHHGVYRSAALRLKERKERRWVESRTALQAAIAPRRF
jgi:glycosyltransferase involved in cell wall biosynthesis